MPLRRTAIQCEEGHMTKCDSCATCFWRQATYLCWVFAHFVHWVGEINTLREVRFCSADVAPLPSSSETLPNIVIKLNKNAKPTGDTSGHLANPKGFKRWFSWVVFDLLLRCWKRKLRLVVTYWLAHAHWVLWSWWRETKQLQGSHVHSMGTDGAWLHVLDNAPWFSTARV